MIIIKFSGITALLAACRGGQIRVLQYLLEAGADITERDNDGKNYYLVLAL